MMVAWSALNCWLLVLGQYFSDELRSFIHDLVPKGVRENRTKGVENKVDDTLKLVVFLECVQC